MIRSHHQLTNLSALATNLTTFLWNSPVLLSLCKLALTMIKNKTKKNNPHKLKQMMYYVAGNKQYISKVFRCHFNMFVFVFVIETLPIVNNPVSAFGFLFQKKNSATTGKFIMKMTLANLYCAATIVTMYCNLKKLATTAGVALPLNKKINEVA